GVADKESPNAPRLVGQGIHDRTSVQLSGCVTSIDVRHFDADIRVRFIPCGGRYHADLGCRIRGRSKGDDPTHVHSCAEPENPFVKRFRSRGIGGVDVGDNSTDSHGMPHTGNAIEYFTWLSAKLDSIEAMPSSRVSLFFRNASYDDRSAATSRNKKSRLPVI